MKNDLIIYYVNNDHREAAEELAGRLGSPAVSDIAGAEANGIYLRFGGDGISLCGRGGEIRADLSRMIPRLRKSNLSGEFLVRAAKIKNPGRTPTAIDATAGFGEDSLLLAAYGFEVTLYEYDPVIAAMLADSLRRAREIPELAEAVSRMTLHEENSIAAMRDMTDPPDVILLDPMFPERRKSALVKKKFQLLHLLESPCSDEKELLEAALSARPKKIIVKRPPKGPYLAGVKPSYSIPGKAVRYDCIIR